MTRVHPRGHQPLRLYFIPLAFEMRVWRSIVCSGGVSSLRYLGGGLVFSAICFGMIVGNFSLGPASGGFIIPFGTMDGTFGAVVASDSPIDCGMNFIISGRRLMREARSGFFSDTCGFGCPGFSVLVGLAVGGGDGVGFSC